MLPLSPNISSFYDLEIRQGADFSGQPQLSKLWEDRPTPLPLST